MNRRLHLEALNVFKFVEQPIPEAPSGGAIVKVSYAGICHSDIHLTVSAHEYHPKFTFPRVLGHEVSGTIYSMGVDATKERQDLAPGDAVCVFPWGMCQDCDNCRAGLPYCTTMHYGSGPVGSYTYGIWRDGGYQNYMVVDLIRFLEKVPSGLQLDQAAILTCSGVTSYNAVSAAKESVMRAIDVSGKATIALIGIGGLALWGIKIIKALLPSIVKVVAVDISDEKLEDAKAAGADLVHKWGTDESAETAATGLVRVVGNHLDAVVDYVGLASVIQRGHLATKIGGTLCLVGLAGKDMPPMTVMSILRRNISIKGVCMGSQPQCRELITLVNDGKVTPPPISHVTLDDIPMVLQRLKEGTQRGRAVVKM